MVAVEVPGVSMDPRSVKGPQLELPDCPKGDGAYVAERALHYVHMGHSLGDFEEFSVLSIAGGVAQGKLTRGPWGGHLMSVPVAKLVRKCDILTAWNHKGQGLALKADKVVAMQDGEREVFWWRRDKCVDFGNEYFGMPGQGPQGQKRNTAPGPEVFNFPATLSNFERYLKVKYPEHAKRWGEIQDDLFAGRTVFLDSVV